MTNFSLDDKCTLPATISPSQNSQVAAPYFSKLKKRWLQKRGKRPPVIGAPSCLYPATVLGVSEDRTSVLIRYHDESPTSSRSISAVHIIYPATAAPLAQRCKGFADLIFTTPEATQRQKRTAMLARVAAAEKMRTKQQPRVEDLESDDGLATPPLPEPSTERQSAAPPAGRRFEAMGKRGPKFWHITQEGLRTTVQYGTVGHKARASHRVHADPDAARIFVDEQIALKREKGYRELAAVCPFGGFGTAFIAKWSQKCSCGCGGKIAPGDDIMPLLRNVDTGKQSQWALQHHQVEARPSSR